MEERPWQPQEFIEYVDVWINLITDGKVNGELCQQLYDCSSSSSTIALSVTDM